MAPLQNQVNLRDKITPEDAEKIQNLATKIVFAIADCGAITISNIDGVRKESTRIHGFQSIKARDIIKDIVEDFILKGY